MITMSSREFNQDVSKAKRYSHSGPVFISDRGHVAHVLLTIDEYHKIINPGQETIVELLSMPEAGDIEFEPPKLSNKLIRPEDFD